MATNDPTIRVRGRDEGASAVLQQIGKNVDAASVSVKRLATSFGALAGSLAVGVIVGGLKSVASAFDDLDEAAQGLGVTAVELAELRIAAQQAGLGTEKLEKGLTALNVKVEEARDGNKRAIATFEALGIAIEVGGKVRPSIDILGDFANRIREFTNDGSKAALLADVLGKKIGPNFAAFLNEGAQGLRIHSGVTAENVEQSKKLQKAIDDLSARFQAYHNSVIGDLATQANSWVELIKRVKEYAAAIPSRGILENLGQLDVALGIAKSRTDALIESERMGAALREQNAQAGKKNAEDTLKAITAREAALKEEERRRKQGQAAGESAAKAAAAFLDQLKKQVLAAQQNEFAVLRLEAAQKGVSKAAEPYIQQLEKAKALNEAIVAFVREQERNERENDAAFAFTRDLSERVQLLALETEQIGKSELEQRKLNAAREIDLAVQERIRALGDDQAAIGRAFNEADETKKRQARLLEVQANKAAEQSLRDLLREVELEAELLGKSNAERQRAIILHDLEKRGVDATSEAYTRLIEQIVKATENSEKRAQLLSDIDRMGQLLSSAFGDLIQNPTDIKGFFKTLEKQVIDLITQLLIVEPLIRNIRAAATGAAGTGGGFDIGKFLSSIIGGGSQDLVGVFARGTDYVPRTGLAVVHEGEAVLTKEENMRGGRGNVTVIQNFSPDTTRATVNQAAAKAGQVLQFSQRRIG